MFPSSSGSVSPLLTSVHFGVQLPPECHQGTGAVLCLVGDSAHLGQWDTKRAVALQQDEGGNWCVGLLFPSGLAVEYKYFLRGDRLLQWEKGPNRTVNISGLEMVVEDGSFRQEHSQAENQIKVDDGWLNHEQLQLNFILGAMDTRTPGKWIRCLALTNGEEGLGTHMKIKHVKASGAGNAALFTLPLESFTQECNFYGGSISELSVVVTIYRHNDKIGRAFLSPEDFKNMRGTFTRPVVNFKGKHIGTFTCSFQIITPMIHPKNSLATLWHEEHKKTPIFQPHIGHRGCGQSQHGKAQANPISENTMLSFLTAAHFGCEYVETDLQLTKDGVPVIFHNYEAKVGPHLQVPICHLTYEQFLQLKPSQSQENFRKILPRLCKSKSMDDLQKGRELGKDRVKMPIHEGFTCLREVLNLVPAKVGFLLEIKYPSDYVTRTRQINYPERNLLVDTILKELFDCNQTRKIIFLSFDPDICVMLKRKQNCWPVLFLTNIGTAEVPIGPEDDDDLNHWDHRTLSFEGAIHFAELAHLRGIVAKASSVLRGPEVVQLAKDKGLVFCTYGEENSDEEKRALQKENGVDALIVDNILKITKKLREKEQISNVVFADQFLRATSFGTETQAVS